MEIIIYIMRCIIMFLVTWLGIRLTGKKSVAQMTSYELAGLLLLTTVAAEPLVYKIPSKATVGVLTLTVITISVSLLSLKKKFYNFDLEPSILIVNGKIDKDEMKKNKMNLTFLLSLLRIQGYNKVSDVEFAIIEPTGQLSVIPKSQSKAVTPQDLKLNTQYEGLALPLILDGEIQYNNLKYADLTTNWLKQELQKVDLNKKTEDVFLAELDTQGTLYVDFYNDIVKKAKTI